MEPTTPVEQAATQAPPQQAEDYKPRFDGAIRKIEELTIANRNIQAQLDAKTSELEQLRAQLSVKDAEKLAAINERDHQIQGVVTSKTEMERELADLRALKLKVDTVNELGRPDLMKIVNTIPSMTDKDALKTVLSTFADYADGRVKEREQQLTAGLTPGMSSVSVAKNALPTSEEAWNQQINSLPLGSKAREQALSQKWNWLMETHKPS